MNSCLAAVLACLLPAMSAAPHAQETSPRPLVAQMPSLGATQVAFNHGGELWLAGREGGVARRMTIGAGVPVTGGSAFSPDGQWLAYTATYGGDADVYLLPLAGGTPTRLTFDQKPDEVVGWSHDGTRVLFRSTRQTFYEGYGLPRVYAVALDGGRPEPLPFPVAYNVALAPDQRTAAVEPQQVINTSWKQHRGGDQRRIVLTDAVTLEERALPGPPANDFDPMWVDGTLYFVSDRSGRQALHAWTPGGDVRKVFDPGWRDIKSASLGPGAIVLSHVDGIGLYDLDSGKTRMLDIAPAWPPGESSPTVDLAQHIATAAIADDGTAAFSARGRVVVVPPRGHLHVHGDSAHAERGPAFRSNTQLSVVTDASGDYRLATRRVGSDASTGSAPLPGAMFHSPVVWSPDGGAGVSMDANLDFWLHRDDREPLKIDSHARAVPWDVVDAAWSPDGRKLAYVRSLDNGLSAVFVWSDNGMPPRQVSPEGLDVRTPAWDADGRRLWFTASDNTPPISTYLDQSSKMRAGATRVLMSIRWQGDGWSHPVRASLPEKRYEKVIAGSAPGRLLLLETEVPPGGAMIGSPLSQVLWSFDADASRAEPHELVDGIETLYPGEIYERATTSFSVSPGGRQVLFRKDNAWMRLDVSGSGAARPMQVPLDEAQISFDARAEWQQIFNDAFRMLQTYFHDARRDPPDFATWKARYAPMLAGLGGREDLTWLLEDIAGELHMSHATLSPAPPLDPAAAGARKPTGALAVDVVADAGRYRIRRIHRGDVTRLGSPAPLDVADLRASEGDVIESIDGKPVDAARDLAEYLVGRAGEPTRLCLVSEVGGRRCASVVPTANESSFRFATWREANRARVDELSGGRLGYIHMSDTVESGMRQFHQARYAQHLREGFVLDVRYNNGGYAADHVIQQLDLQPMSRMLLPRGRSIPTPGARLGGPKALLTNAYCGSGCDTLAWYFSRFQAGPLVGTPTWGGVSGSGSMPFLRDGSWFSVPSYTMIDAQGRFVLEGEAVQPTIPVEIPASDFAADMDLQLDRAVEELMGTLASVE